MGRLCRQPCAPPGKNWLLIVGLLPPRVARRVSVEKRRRVQFTSQRMASGRRTHQLRPFSCPLCMPQKGPRGTGP